MRNKVIAFFWLLALFAFGTNAQAKPVPGNIGLDRPCFLFGSGDANPRELIRENGRFNCTLDPRKASADTTWVLHDLSSSRPFASDSWAYAHAVNQAQDERVWALYDDGRVYQSRTSREDARHVLEGPTQYFALEKRPGRIVAVLARVDDLQNRRGPVPRAQLVNDQSRQDARANINLIFGIVVGVMIGILFYNLTLYASLRYRVLLAYSAYVVAILLYGAVWSNLILWPFPQISTATQFGLNALSISFCFLATSIYFHALMEPGTTSRRIAYWGSAICLTAVALSILRTLIPTVPWQIVDRLTYGGFLLAILLLVANCSIAWRRDSFAVKLFLLAWTVTVVAAAARLLWGLGIIKVENALFDASPFISLALEGLLSAVGLSWRLRQLRSERDTAEVKANQYYELASADPLTGLLNRRAFLEAVTGLEGPRALLIIDIDHFKSINDTFGHDQGDGVLRRVAQALRDVAPPEAVIGRLGGEEFAVICAAGSAEPLGQRLRLAVSVAASWPERHVTVSIGAANGLLVDYGDWRALYVLADKALYQSKKDGRDRITHSHMRAAA